MQNELKKLTKNQLVELVAHFEHYPAVTEESDRDYILAYLEDESCTIKEDEILEYMFKMGVEITEENLPLYHKFMSDEDLIYNRKIVDSVLAKRLKMLADVLNIKNNKELQVFGVEGLNGSDMTRIHSLDVVFNNYLLKTVIYEVEDTLAPINEYIEEIKNSDAFKEFKRDILIQEAIDITNVVIIDFSEDEVAEYIERCIKYLNKRFGSKYVLEIWETDEIYGQRDDEDDYSEEYKGHLMYQGKIAIYDGVFEKDIKFTGIYCEISAVFSDLLSSLETIEKETISKAS